MDIFVGDDSEKTCEEVEKRLGCLVQMCTVVVGAMPQDVDHPVEGRAKLVAAAMRVGKGQNNDAKCGVQFALSFV